MRWLAALLLMLVVAAPAYGQTPSPPQPPQAKIDDLLRLLQDPDVRTWLESRKPAAEAGADTTPAAATEAADPDDPGLSEWETRMRGRIQATLSAIPLIPSEVAAAAARAKSDAVSHGYAPIFVIFAGLVIVGGIAETIFRRIATRRDRVHTLASAAVAELLPVAVFALSMSIVFFAVPWPPLARIVLLAFLIAFVTYRVLSVLVGLAAPSPGLRSRIKLFFAVLLVAMACASLGHPLAVAPIVTHAVSYLFSILLLIIAIEAIWRVSEGTRAMKIALTGALLVIWALWSLDFKGLFWLGIYALVLPGLLRTVGRSVETAIAARPGARANDTRTVLLVRGSRAIIIAAAVGWLAMVWRLNPQALAHENAAVTSVLYGLLKSVIVLLVADLVWHLAKASIDRKLEHSDSMSGLAPAEAARRGRLRTLLPIFRNALAVTVLVMACLIVLSQLGVEIGPLIAGAGIFGVALGFGSQTLVKDVISGVFYMLDDAFRVGEYIQSKSYKGTVESFSLRSVRLRHHRGPVFTVPFGELGAVENMSRDWVIDKFRISVGYDTDINKARKLAKTIGAELQADPEMGPMFIEPLKMKGVEEFGDYGIVLSFAMTTVPGQQTYIRRKAYAMIREAFQQNGIEFAQPSVQVGGDDKAGAAAAATAVRQTQIKQQAAEG